MKVYELSNDKLRQRDVSTLASLVICRSGFLTTLPEGFLDHLRQIDYLPQKLTNDEINLLKQLAKEADLI